MMRIGTRVVVVDAVKAEKWGAVVHNGQVGVITGKGPMRGHVAFKPDNDTSRGSWLLSAKCLKEEPSSP